MTYATNDNIISLKWLLLILIMSVVSSNGFAQCLDSRGICGAGDVEVTTAGDTQDPGYETVYVLVDQVTGLVVASNTTGIFTADVVPGNVYLVHTLNYDTNNAPDPLPINTGDDPTTIGSTTMGCYNSADFLTEYLCLAINLEATICDGDALEVTTTGNNTMPGFATVFILVDQATGLVVASNMTGIFTPDVSAGNSYQIHTLNYDTNNPPAPLPTNPGDDPTTIGTTTAGCYNVDDFIIEFLCVTVVPIPQICEGDPLEITTTGNNTMPGYATVFVLVDRATGLVVASNTTGIFTADVVAGNTYQIHTLNYDTTNPPVPLPINAGDDPTTIGATTAGCYDANFLTEILCVLVNPCVCLDEVSICEGDDLVVTTTGNTTTPGYETVFILVDVSNLNIVVASNTTGNFTNDVAGSNSYQIYTLNYNTTSPPVPLPTNVGDDITTIGSTTMGCYNDVDFLLEFLCVNVAESAIICEGDALQITTTGNNTNGHETVYVLVDRATGLVVTSNTTGDFTNDVVAPNCYTMHVLNYNLADPPVPLPIVPGANPTTIGSIAQGCYDTDFLTEFLCVCVRPAVEICEGDPLVATTTGNTISGHTTVYVLVDAAGIVVASNTTGDFTNDVVSVNDYTIHVLNYNTSDPPAPLPTNPGDNISTIGTTTMGCYDTDFLTEYLCVSVIYCCKAEAGVVSADFNCPGDGTDCTVTANNTADPDYESYVLVTDLTGNIIGVFPVDAFGQVTIPYSFWPVLGQDYLIYSYNYDTTNPPTLAPAPADLVGQNINDVINAPDGCSDVSNQFDQVYISAPLTQLCSNQTSNGNAGGVSPFYYNTHEICAGGGTPPYDYVWCTEGYVRHTENGTSFDANGIPQTGADIIYDDGAIWAVTIFDANGCTNVNWMFTNDPAIAAQQQTGTANPPGSTGAILDIFYDYQTPATDCIAAPNTGVLEICVEGGATGNYVYDWYGPFTWTSGPLLGVIADDPANGVDLENAAVHFAATGGIPPGASACQIGGTQPAVGTNNCFILSNLPQGWYEVTVTDTGPPAETTTRWFWIHCNYANTGGGRGKISSAEFENGIGMLVYPNPFKEEATVQFSVAETTNAVVELYTIAGKKVAQVFNGEMEAHQTYAVTLNSQDNPNGMYLLQMRTDTGKQLNQKLIIAK